MLMPSSPGSNREAEAFLAQLEDRLMNFKDVEFRGFLLPEEITLLFVADATAKVLAMAIPALQLFALTYLTRWLSFATQSYMLAIEKPVPAALISVSTALIFPVILIGALWPLGLTGIWLNFGGNSLLTGILAAIVLLRFQRNSRLPRYESTQSS